MLDEDAQEALQGAQDGAVHHVGAVLPAIGPHIDELEPLRQIEVELHGGALPGPAQGVADLHVDLRP